MSYTPLTSTTLVEQLDGMERHVQLDDVESKLTCTGNPPSEIVN